MGGTVASLDSEAAVPSNFQRTSGESYRTRRSPETSLAATPLHQNYALVYRICRSVSSLRGWAIEKLFDRVRHEEGGYVAQSVEASVPSMPVKSVFMGGAVVRTAARGG